MKPKSKSKSQLDWGWHNNHMRYSFLLWHRRRKKNPECVGQKSIRGVGNSDLDFLSQFFAKGIRCSCVHLKVKTKKQKQKTKIVTSWAPFRSKKCIRGSGWQNNINHKSLKLFWFWVIMIDLKVWMKNKHYYKEGSSHFILIP